MSDIAGEFCGQVQPHASHLWSTPQIYGSATFTSVHQCAGTTPPPHPASRESEQAAAGAGS